jgi:hypothetical protein
MEFHNPSPSKCKLIGFSAPQALALQMKCAQLVHLIEHCVVMAKPTLIYLSFLLACFPSFFMHPNELTFTIADSNTFDCSIKSHDRTANSRTVDQNPFTLMGGMVFGSVFLPWSIKSLRLESTEAGESSNE